MKRSRQRQSEEVSMRTYNLFRRKNAADLYCAVPVDVAVPSFITDRKWEFAQAVDIGALSGFDAAAAEVSAAVNGFYLFQSAN
jgi:hypothetical protein